MLYKLKISKEVYDSFQDLDEDARSKAQRRLFAMALAHKRGKLDSKYVNDDIIKISKLPEATLDKFAKTKQKKRKSSGAIGKRDAIPNYTREGKKYKTLPNKYRK